MPWAGACAATFAALVTDTIILLPGWQRSMGASLEAAHRQAAVDGADRGDPMTIAPIAADLLVSKHQVQRLMAMRRHSCGISRRQR